jgi:dolichol-phosphate mannosyltransferase
MKITKDEIAVIVPAYNEKANIPILIREIHKYVNNALIYIVDDNSPDGTKHVVKKLSVKNPKIHLVVRNSKSGRGGAVLEGFRHALKNNSIQYIVEMDADLSHAPDEIPRVLSKRSKNTLVIGSRYVTGSKIINWPKRRIFFSHLANMYARLVLGVPINDFTNGFRCYTREAAQILLKKNIEHKGFITLSETAYVLNKKGFSFVEVPITFRDRTRGKSNATLFEVIKSLFAILQIKFKQ